MNLAAPDPVSFLLVDDREQNLTALQALLQRDGLTTLKAHSGVEALELLLKHDVALALIDVQMPEMDGFELAEMMRGSERTRRIPIIFLTAGGTDQQRRFRGYEAGAVDFLHKPIEPDILRGKAAVFFDLYRQRQEVARHRDELAAVVEENHRLLVETQQAATALREADRRKDEFLAMLAHELRNPLAPVRAGLELLALSGVEQESVNIMRDQVQHLVRMVDDLLDVSRIMQSKIQLRLEELDLLDVVRKAVDAIRPKLVAAGQVWEVHLPDQPVRLRGDAVRLSQVLVNLLNNAIKYTPAQGRISLDVSVTPLQVTIVVKDSGVGLEPELLPRVFDLFTQADRSLERSEGGLGIGLTLVKTLVELHQGTVSAHSAGTDQGSEFRITLPLSPEPAALTPPVSTTTALTVASSAPRRVMLVDDQVGTTTVQSLLLKKLGNFEVRTANDGLTALHLAKEFLPDIMLLDIGLPQMNGYDVARHLRALPEFDHTLLVALTGYGSAEDRRRSQEAGFDLHLVKPPSLEQLQSVLSSPRRTP